MMAGRECTRIVQMIALLNTKLVINLVTIANPSETEIIDNICVSKFMPKPLGTTTKQIWAYNMYLTAKIFSVAAGSVITQCSYIAKIYAAAHSLTSPDYKESSESHCQMRDGQK